MKKLQWTIVVIFLLLAGPVTAQFYRYIDQNGNLRFTDDLNKVPAEQRENIREYHETETGSAPSSKEAVTEKEKSPSTSAESSLGQKTGVVANGADGTVSLEEIRAKIEKMKEQIEAEYLELTKEKNTLAKERASKKTREEMVSYNESVDAFNQRAENYDKMSSQLRKLVDEYNAFLKEKNAKDQ